MTLSGIATAPDTTFSLIRCTTHRVFASGVVTATPAAVVKSTSILVVENGDLTLALYGAVLVTMVDPVVSLPNGTVILNSDPDHVGENPAA